QKICAFGCKSNAGCAANGSTLPLCDLTRHQCVACLTVSDCPPGQVCSVSGLCANGCDNDNSCTGVNSCCTPICTATHGDHFNCNGCGKTCAGGETLCCNGECANPSTSAQHCGTCDGACSTLNGTPVCNAGHCDWSCLTGFIHCGSGNTGCETRSDTVDNCG